MLRKVWKLDDGRIEKTVVEPGTGFEKPTELCECNIIVNDEEEQTFTVGIDKTDRERCLSVVLQKMCVGEVAKVKTLDDSEEKDKFSIKLVTFKSCGLIYEWDANFKMEKSKFFKSEGNEFYSFGNYKEASFKYSKAIKYILSIPIDVEVEPETIDGVSVTDINALKVVLYNNLALCALKISQDYDRVAALCLKAHELDSSNVKTLYKLGEAYSHSKQFERALKYLKKAAEVEPDNKAVRSRLKETLKNVIKENSEVNHLYRRMFQ